MTFRTFTIGFLSALFALLPVAGFAHHDADFDDYSYDDLYGDMGTYDDPYSIHYGSTNSDPYAGGYYGNQQYYNSYPYPQNAYTSQGNMPGYRCYYWGRDGSCMNYSYRQAPSYYGGYPYGGYPYENEYDNDTYDYADYGYYGSGCGRRDCW